MTKWHRSPVVVAVLALGASIAAVAHRGSDGNTGRKIERRALDGAIAFFTARRAERPRDFVAAMELADRYLMRFGSERHISDLWRADSAVRQALVAHPRFARALTSLAAVHIARHEFPEALTAAQRAFTLAPRRARNGPLFDAFFEVGRYDSAQAVLGQMDPNSFEYLIRKARFAEQLGYVETARTALARACRPANHSQAGMQAWCAVRRANIEEALGRLRRADRLYRQALQFWPEYTAALMGLGGIALKQERLADARRLYQAAARQPGAAEAHLMLARIATLQGVTERAAQQEARFEWRATNARYGRAFWSLLARHYAQTGRMRMALDLARRDVAQRPGPEAYHTLAVVLMYAGRATEAQVAMDSALTWGPPDAEMLFHSGLIHFTNGEHTRGKDAFRAALADPAGLESDYARVAQNRLNSLRASPS